MENGDIKVECLKDFKKTSAYFDIFFTKGNIYEVKKINGKNLLNIGIYYIDFLKVCENFVKIS